MEASLWITYNDSNETEEFIDMAPRVATVIQFSIVGGIGVIVNVLPITVTIAGYVERNVVNAMIVNLAFTELLLCTSFVFGQSFFVLWREWLPDGGCHFLSFLHFMAAFASFMFPPMLAFNRYIALYKPGVYDRWYTAHRVAIAMGSCWGFCAVVPFAFFLAGKTGKERDYLDLDRAVVDAYLDASRFRR